MLTSDLFFLIFLEVLERLTSDRRLRALLSYIWGTFGLPPTESPWGMTALLQKHYFDGAYNKQKHVLQSLPKCRTPTFAICPKKMIHKRRILSRGRLLQSLPKCRTPTFAICRKLNQKKAHTIPWADLHKSPLGSCRRSPEVFFSLSLDPFLPYVRAHSSHISPFKFCFCSGRRRPCARPRHESAHRGRSRQKATTRNGNSLHQHILSHSIVLDEVFGPFVKRHVGTLVVYFFSFFMSNRRVNDSSIFSNRVNDSFVF